MDKKKGINIEIIIVIEGDLITRHPNTLCIHHSRFLGVYLLKLRVTEETVRQTVFRSLLRVCLGNNDCPPAALRRDSVRERKSTFFYRNLFKRFWDSALKSMQWSCRTLR